MVDAVVGGLKRKQGVFGRMREFTYVKKGVFLYEYQTNKHYDDDPPRRLYDISGAKVHPIQGGGFDPATSFRVVTRSSEEIDFVAENAEERKKWFDSLSSTVERTSFMSCAALIAPVRRRQSSISYTMKKKNMKSICVIKVGRDGVIKSFDKPTLLMFEMKEDDFMNQSIRAMFTSEAAKRFMDQFIAYVADPSAQTKPVPVRNMVGCRKNKEEFPISVSLDKQDDNTFRVKILDRSTPLTESAMTEKDEYKTMATLKVEVMEGKDIGKIKSETNPYCVILLDEEEKTTTTTKNKTTTPFWGQEYIFDDIKPTNRKITIMINNQNKRMMDPRIGLVEINIQELNPAGRPLDKWFPLQPVEGQKSNLPPNSSIRLKIALTVEKILPLKEYKEFLDLFLDDKLTCATALAKATVNQLDEVAGTLVNMYAMKNRVTDFVRRLTALEVARTDRGNILFRGNSLGTKVIDLYMKMVGYEYLLATLTPIIDEILRDKESCEVDPTRLSKGMDVKKNQKRLIMYTKKVFDQVVESIDDCPTEMRMVFANIRSEVTKKFNDIERHTSVSGFIFLRFFCPAILNPKMFGIIEEHPDGTAARNLTLIAKGIQNLANLVPNTKEQFMGFMEEFLASQIGPMQDCVTKFSTLPEDAAFEFSGVLNKKDLGREMSALHRHCMESKEELVNSMLDDPDSKLNELFKVMQLLEKRLGEYERKALEFVKNNPVIHRPSISLTGIKE